MIYFIKLALTLGAMAAILWAGYPAIGRAEDSERSPLPGTCPERSGIAR
jgi:hypothetical protein